MQQWAKASWVPVNASLSLRWGWLLLVALGLWAAPAAADDGDSGTTLGVPTLRPAPDLSAVARKPIARIQVLSEGGRWSEKSAVQLQRVRAGEALTPEVARRAMRELTDTGRYASVRAEVLEEAGGLVLRLHVLPRRILAGTRLSGATLDSVETLRAAGVSDGGEVTAPELPKIAGRIQAFYARHGYPRVRAKVDTLDTDDPMRVLLLIEIDAGTPRRIARRVFRVGPDPRVPGIVPVLRSYGVDSDDRADQEQLAAADSALEKRLRAAGWFRAGVSHKLERLRSGHTQLAVLVRAGPLVQIRYEGNRHFDRDQLTDALGLADSDDRSSSALTEKLLDYYRRRGFLDVEISAEERGGALAAIHDLVFTVHEHLPVKVASREYPCLSGGRSASDVGSEIDSFLSEELPGADIFEPTDPARVDKNFGPHGNTGSRPKPYELNPWRTYVDDVYERAMKHVQDLYRSEGYLSATVGPAQLLRRRCSVHSPPGRCVPIGPRVRPKTACRVDEIGVPLDEPPPDKSLTCTPDPLRGISCEPEVVLHIPIKLGPQTFLYDVVFEGNKVLVEQSLAEAAELGLGDPVSQVEVDKARRRVLDAYAEEGFAFAETEAALEFSADRTRARVRFTIAEREQVRVSGIVVRGARRTNESLILRRVALTVGEPYRRSDVRKTEERLATLGVFSNVSVGLEDPYVPAKEKVVVITVQEKKPQYLDIRPGFSTGEGFRVTFEYGHRNLAGEAIQLTLRVQLGYLPTAFILEEDVRRKYDELDIGQRLERRNTASVEFPEIGLGPLFRFNVEGVDVRDNSRDFGLTKDAGIVTLIFRPDRRFSAQLGASLELNTAEIFGAQEKDALQQYVTQNPSQRNAFRVPQGTTLAKAERVGFTWDLRDNPLDATRGTLLSAGVEHVRADPIGETRDNATGGADVFQATTSQFLRITNRLAGYGRLSKKGLAIALSFRWGYNLQLLTPCRDLPPNQQLLDQCSQTYPDRLFFLGGVDSLRGYLQDSVVPEDVAEQLLDPNSGLSLQQVVIRGGDVFVNPRAELRIPLTESVKTALFVDAGNLWRDPTQFDPSKLRYAAGSGVRIGTPIGPLVFDYGFNLERVADELLPSPSRVRRWESLGAFHFSIGLF